jgi:phosphatidylserine/phosphatidylglycerophosphate/cardiolipin synthase-like enzyme
MAATRLGLVLALVGTVGCTTTMPAQRSSARQPPAKDEAATTAPSAPTCPKVGPQMELVESTPVEAELASSRLPSTQRVWVAMIDGAQRSLDLEQFYVANRPTGRLEPVIQAIERAAKRGVKVRLLAETSLADEYPETLERLAQHGSVRRITMAEHMGGVQHAKFFIVDGCEVYFGSANFDWRSLEHIHELGLRIRSPELATALSEVFALDWQLAGGQLPARGQSQVWDRFPIALDGEAQVLPAFSPAGWLPDERSWDLPQLLDTIDGAQRSVRLQLLTYSAHFRDGSPFPALDDALRRAAGRGVKVQVMVSNWQQQAGRVEDLQALVASSPVEARLITIPEHSSGFIPYARVIHTKAMVVDGQTAWVGTSNWGGDYFHLSRNVGVLVKSQRLARQLEATFDRFWQSGYGAAVDPKADYAEPRIGP